MKFIINKAYDELIEKYPDKSFAPKDSLTFEEMRKLVENYTSVEDMEIVTKLVKTNTNAIVFI